MHKRLVCLCLWASAGFVFLCPALFADPGATTSAPDEWAGKLVMARSPQAVLRERPDEEAQTIRYSLEGIILTVGRAERGWLHVAHGWIKAADAVPLDQTVECFTAQLAQGETVFAYLGRARRWLDRGDADRAQADVSEALRLDPNNARAILLRARIAHEQQRSDAALADCDLAAQLDAQDPLCFDVRSYILSQRGEFDRAIADLTTALALMPSDATCWGRRGWCYARKGDLEGALSDFSEAIRLDPTTARGYSQRAAIHLRRQRYDQALADAEEAVRIDPKMAHAFAVRGETLAAQGKPDEALRDFDESVRLGLSDTRVYIQRGRVHVAKNDLDAALRDFTQALSLNPNDSYTYYHRAGLWSRKGDDANAITDLGEYLRLKPDAVDVWVVRGRLRTQAGDDDEALKDFGEALRLNPRHIGALMGQAFVWERKHEEEKALQALNSVIDIGTAPADVYERRARIFIERNEHDLAIGDLSAALRLEPKNTDRLVLRALELTAAGNIEKALDDCRAALSIDPKKLMAYYYMAIAHSRAGKLEQAIEDFDTAIRLDPDDVEMRFLRAYELFNQDQFDRALAGIDEVIRAGTKVPEAYSWRGYFRMLREEWDEAIADYSEALRLEPDDASLLARRATCRIEVGELDKALQDAEEALRLDPTSTEAADARKVALAAKRGEPIRKTRVTSSRLHGISTTVSEDAKVTGDYAIELDVPRDIKLAVENLATGEGEFEEANWPAPRRLPMVNRAIVRFKLVSAKEGGAQDLYVRIRSEDVSSEQVATLKKAMPRLTLTDADLELARSGTDVIKLLVLPKLAEMQSAEQPVGAGVEVLSSNSTLLGPALRAQALRRGTVAVELCLSHRLPRMIDDPGLPPPDHIVHFELRGPRGLSVDYELPGDGEFINEPVPVPAHFGLMLGMSMRFQITNAPLPETKPLYLLLTVGDSWPEALGDPLKTMLPIHFSKADLEAAAGGNAVTYVLYLPRQVAEQATARVETMRSNAMPAGSNLPAEASKQGTILAIAKLSKELPALPQKR